MQGTFLTLEQAKKLEEYEKLKERIDKAYGLLEILHYQFPDYDDIHKIIEDIQKILKGE